MRKPICSDVPTLSNRAPPSETAARIRRKRNGIFPATLAPWAAAVGRCHSNPSRCFMSDLEHFLRLAKDGGHCGCSRGEYAARRLAQALVNSWPLLDAPARRGAVDLAMMVSRSPADAAAAAGVWDDQY